MPDPIPPIGAAYIAAADGGVVTMPIVLEAARDEHRKANMPHREADFRHATPAAGSPA